MRRITAKVILLGGLLCGLFGNFFPVSSASGILDGLLAATPTTLVGEFLILWGDQAPGEGGGSWVLYQLTEAGGQAHSLAFGEKLPLPYDQLLRLRGSQVRVTGWRNPSVQVDSGSAPFQVASFSPVKDLDPQASGLSLQSISGDKPFLSILCKFPDTAAEPRTLGYFRSMVGDAYPALGHYWRELSGDRVTLTGSSALGWYTLPYARSTYLVNNTLDFYRIASDCTALADPDADFTSFYGINLMFNDHLDGYAWGGGLVMTLDGLERFWPLTWEPPWGYQHVTTLAHEMGHAFGLPHSSGMYGQTYDNRWDVMSDTWSDCVNLMDPVYGCLGQGTIGYHLDQLGWVPAHRKASAVAGVGGAYTLVQLNSPPASGLMLLKVNLPGTSNRFFTVEVRQKTGYDVKLPLEGVVIHEVSTLRYRPAQVADSDNNGNTGDEGAVWRVGETFSDPASGVLIRVTGGASGSYTVEVQYASVATATPTPTRTPTPTTVPTVMVVYSNRLMLPVVVAPGGE